MDMPANMTDDADEAQGLPGADAIPADMANSPHGDISLEYTLQNFNALVAANTAMETEIGSLNEKMDLIAQQRNSFKEGLDFARGDSAIYLTQIKDLQAADRDSRKRLDEKDADLQFARDQAAVLQRRLDRSLGYLDRVLDDEDSIQSGETRSVTAVKPPVGPALDMISDAVRPSRNGERVSSLFAGEAFRVDDGTGARRRRY